MGNAALPPIKDARILAVAQKLKLTNDDISKMWLVYAKYDREGIGQVSIDELHNKVLKEPRNIVSDAMLEFIGADSFEYITFGEFVELICLFSLFEKYDILRFMFYILDKRKVGTLDPKELKACISELYEGKLKSNAKLGFSFIDSVLHKDGRLGFRELADLHRRFPYMLYPVFRLQKSLMRVGMGESWWEGRKIALAEEARIAKLREKRQEELMQIKVLPEDEAKALLEEKVRQYMGPYIYFLFPCRREYARNRVKRLEQIERELAYIDQREDDDSDDGHSVDSKDKYLVLNIKSSNSLFG